MGRRIESASRSRSAARIEFFWRDATMAQPSLEKRLNELERQVSEIRETVAKLAAAPDWRSTIGMFTGDEFMLGVFAEAQKIREADRRKARREYAKQKVKK